jgi:hypothetical protein
MPCRVGDTSCRFCCCWDVDHAVPLHVLQALCNSVHQAWYPCTTIQRMINRGCAPEQHDVWLWPVNSVVLPAAGLLHAQASPFVLQQQMAGNSG